MIPPKKENEYDVTTLLNECAVNVVGSMGSRDAYALFDEGSMIPFTYTGLFEKLLTSLPER